jgi:alcohol dehydrogenase, propanol-preferring
MIQSKPVQPSQSEARRGHITVELFLFILTDLHTARGTATGADGKPITNIKFPHVGGHEGVGRVVSFGPNTSPSAHVDVGTLVGIRFLSRVCHACDFCISDREQHCAWSSNHLHHEDGSFQEYCVLDMKYLTILPGDVDVRAIGPVLCAGVTAYKVSILISFSK